MRISIRRFEQVSVLICMTLNLHSCTLGRVLGSGQNLDDQSLRFLSMAIKNEPATVEEAKSYFAGNTTIEQLTEQWMQSDAHYEKIRLLFDDRAAIARNGLFFVSNNFYLVDNANGGYRLPIRPDCAVSDLLTVDTWWATGVQMCSNSVSSGIKTNGVYCGNDQGLVGEPRCGCGEGAILCLPKDAIGKFIPQIHREISDRAVDAYKENSTWKDYLAGDEFFGSKYVYWFYIYLGRIVPSLFTVNLPVYPDANELHYMRNVLPAEGGARVPFPVGPPLRGGIATAPAWLKGYNNYRSRTRALVFNYLCRDVDSTLNTDNTNIWYNPYLQATNTHGAIPGCASCHYPMDNMGIALNNFDDQGMYKTYDLQSEIAHSFGQTGEGPVFLLETFAENAPGFHDCMVRSFWKDISGEEWHVLSPQEKQSLESASQRGPREMIRAIMLSQALRRMRQ